MILTQQIRRFLVTMGLAIVLATVTAFSFQVTDTWATTSIKELIGQSEISVTAMNPAEAMFNNIQGKAQEVMGDVTGNSKDQIEGKAKQAKSHVMNAVEDAKQEGSKLKNKAEKLAKNLKNKVDQARNN